MSKITVNITRANIYHIAEGISVSISQHNGGTPTFEQLWASPDESAKLDIYYREAISDLEAHLTEWLKLSSGQFDLHQDGTDYTLTLSVSRFWPQRLQGLLVNKIQDYLVHAVTAGWLNDFTGLETKQDYKAMAGQDLSDIRGVLYKRDYSFHTGYRNEDNVTRLDNSEVPPYCGEKNLRHRDNDIVDIHHDHTDWSGAGMQYRDQMSCHSVPPSELHLAGCEVRKHSHRVSCGRGYTPSAAECMKAHCPVPPPNHSNGKDPRIPDNLTHPNYPPIHTDGVEWTDEALYNINEAEQFVNSDN